jgi:hypothetical protein
VKEYEPISRFSTFKLKLSILRLPGLSSDEITPEYTYELIILSTL